MAEAAAAPPPPSMASSGSARLCAAPAREVTVEEAGEGGDWLGEAWTSVTSVFGTSDADRLRGENARLRSENARLRALASARGASSDDLRRAARAFSSATPARAVATLYGDESRSDRAEVDASAAALVVVSDCGRSLDDELALVLLRALADRGTARIAAYVANGHPAFARARLARGALDALGLYHVAVGVGTDGGAASRTSPRGDDGAGDVDYSGDDRRRAAESPLISGRRLLHRAFVRAGPRSLTLVLLSSLKDAALFLRDNEHLFSEKAAAVVIAGVDVVRGDDGALAPAQSAGGDRHASLFLLAKLRALRVPLVVVGDACTIEAPRRWLDALADAGSPLGRRLRNAYRTRAAAATAAAARAEYGVVDAPPGGGGGDDDAWERAAFVRSRALAAAIAAVPSLRERYLDVDGSRVVGVRDAAALEAFLGDALLESVAGLRDDPRPLRMVARRAESDRSVSGYPFEF